MCGGRGTARPAFLFSGHTSKIPIPKLQKMCYTVFIYYVKEGIEETLRDVPADKVINAVPFYTRLWNETPKTDEERAEDQGTEAESYSMKVTSEALGMEEAAQRVSEAGATVTWDDTVKQNYAEWQGDNDSTYRIWLEDASSLEVKLGLMKDNNLAGTAAWKLGFETSDIWDLIQKYVN